MDKSKVVLIILAVLFLGSAFLAFNFYTQAQRLLQEKQGLIQDNKELSRRLDKYRKDNRELSSKNRELSSRVREIEEELDRIEKERDGYRRKYEEASREKDSLVEEIKRLKQGRVERPAVPSEKVSDEYWQDVLQKKAELQIKVEDLTSQLKEKISQLAELQRKNEDLLKKSPELEKEKEELEKKLIYNERTIEILTKDLVREREDRKAALEEIEKLKEENISLKRDLELVKKIRGDLEEKLAKTQDEKQILERKVKDMETILKDKALEMDALQKQLSQVISSAKEVMPKEAKAVELPPIVVKSSAQPNLPTTILEGKILVVNEKENFVIIDLGASSGIKPGNKFSVIRQGNLIGSLEVIETRQDISACDIKSSKERLKEGDIVRFSP